MVSLLVVHRLSRLSSSELVVAERARWKAGASLSVVIAVGGAIALFLDGTGWDEDAVRHAIIDGLAPLGHDVRANVELTTDADLAG